MTKAITKDAAAELAIAYHDVMTMMEPPDYWYPVGTSPSHVLGRYHQACYETGVYSLTTGQWDKRAQELVDELNAHRRAEVDALRRQEVSRQRPAGKRLK